MKSVAGTLLLYVTRDYDRKREQDVTGHLESSTVAFSQKRWHELYQFLGERASFEFENPLLRETLFFMEEHNMAHNNRFSPLETLAITQFPRALAIMRETMWGAIAGEFKNSFGAINLEHASMTRMRDHKQYAMYSYNPTRIDGVLGFDLQPTDDSQYPNLFVMMEVHKQVGERWKDIVASFNQFQGQNPNWQSTNLSGGPSWACMKVSRSLREFVNEEDHVAAIQKWFRTQLETVHIFRNCTPHLPWNG